MLHSALKFKSNYGISSNPKECIVFSKSVTFVDNGSIFSLNIRKIFRTYYLRFGVRVYGHSNFCWHTTFCIFFWYSSCSQLTNYFVAYCAHIILLAITSLFLFIVLAFFWRIYMSVIFSSTELKFLV